MNIKIFSFVRTILFKFFAGGGEAWPLVFRLWNVSNYFKAYPVIVKERNSNAIKSI